MQAHFELVPETEASFYAYERLASDFPFDWHFHPEIELTCILAGTGQRFIGTDASEYRPGDMVLVGPNLPHTWRSDPYPRSRKTANRAVVVQFRPEEWNGMLGLREFHGVASLLQKSAYGISFAPSASLHGLTERLLRLTQLKGAAALLELLHVLDALSHERNRQSLSGPEHTFLCRAQDIDRVRVICDYLHRNARRKIDFQVLAARAGMDQAALCRFFRRASGRTLTEFIHLIRTRHATHLLRTTSTSVIEVGLTSGYSNHSHFVRQFKRLTGLTPRSYREAHGQRM